MVLARGTIIFENSLHTPETLAKGRRAARPDRSRVSASGFRVTGKGSRLSNGMLATPGGEASDCPLLA
ncbi:hypothetical protein SAE02_15900 [Skermanella aerolata]|uniref:Uncharacterized protein n=1 Tax=Skermanella aerolata TaxID=393310 RepID=A0A512DLT5_9PROT|nr:hypothetical protein SAE02_15900 [Skermanella aerolata]